MKGGPGLFGAKKDDATEFKALESSIEGDDKKMELEGKLGLGPENGEAPPMIDDHLESSAYWESEGNVQDPSDTYPQFSPQTPQCSSDGVTSFQLQPIMALEWARASDLLMTVLVCDDFNKQRIIEHSFAAMEELTKKALELEPQGKPHGEGHVMGDECIHEFASLKATIEEITKMVEVGESMYPILDNSAEYICHDQTCNLTLPDEEPQPTPVVNSASGDDFSRETAVILIDPIGLVEELMDVNQWSSLFCNIVSRALTLGVLSRGVAGTLNGAIQVMMAEFHLPSPHVPTQESYFARYCKQLSGDTWAVVDVSLENLIHGPGQGNYRRRPSGCLIQELPNGYSKVTWVEHVEIDHASIPDVFKPLIISCFAFSARRWVSSLVRQKDRVSSAVACSTFDHEGVITQSGKRSLMKLGERMMQTFWADTSDSSMNQWQPLPVSGSEDVMVMMRNNFNDPGRPPGVTLVFATTVWVAAPPRKVFDFLRDVNSRTKWEIFSNGQNEGHCFSVVEMTPRGNEPPVLYLQESCSEATGSYIVYAPIDVYAMSVISKGGNSDWVAMLPSGYAILPDSPTTSAENIDGSFLTVAFEVVDNDSTPNYIPPQTVGIMHELMQRTVQMIKSTFLTGQHALSF